jgi:hypothetical protein
MDPICRFGRMVTYDTPFSLMLFRDFNRHFDGTSAGWL